MLDAQNLVRLRRRELIFCHIPSNIMYNKGYFYGFGKSSLLYNSIPFFYICAYSLFSKKMTSLMYNILWVGYLSSKLKYMN